jgi:hypothetical protein
MAKLRPYKKPEPQLNVYQRRELKLLLDKIDRSVVPHLTEDSDFDDFVIPPHGPLARALSLAASAGIVLAIPLRADGGTAWLIRGPGIVDELWKLLAIEEEE